MNFDNALVVAVNIREDSFQPCSLYFANSEYENVSLEKIKYNNDTCVIKNACNPNKSKSNNISLLECDLKNKDEMIDLFLPLKIKQYITRLISSLKDEWPYDEKVLDRSTDKMTGIVLSTILNREGKTNFVAKMELVISTLLSSFENSHLMDDRELQLPPVSPEDYNERISHLKFTLNYYIHAIKKQNCLSADDYIRFSGLTTFMFYIFIISCLFCSDSASKRSKNNADNVLITVCDILAPKFADSLDKFFEDFKKLNIKN